MQEWGKTPLIKHNTCTKIIRKRIGEDFHITVKMKCGMSRPASLYKPHIVWTSEYSAAMFLNVLVMVLALCTQSLSARSYYRTLWVRNGGPWGHWHRTQMCPTGSFAGGFSMRVEGRQGWGDDTAVNGIRLYCVRNGRHYGSVQSHSGYWGRWTSVKWCRSGGLLQRFLLNVEDIQFGGDDTLVNNIHFSCSNGQTLTGHGMPWGHWGPWSHRCDRGGICGIQTRVERPQGGGDDTALNDVRFVCCSK